MKKETCKVVARMATEALDDVPMGVIRVSNSRHIEFINRAGRTILGSHVPVGTPLADVPMDLESRKRLDAELRDRMRGEGSAYQLTLIDPRWGTQKRVEVTGVPEYDLDGVMIGSLAFLRNLSFESANQNIHRAIEESGNWQQLLERVAAELRKVIHYDSFLVTLVSDKRGHLRSLFEDPPFLQASPIRWWPMPPFVSVMLAGIDRTTQLSVDEMFSSDDYQEMLRTDASTRSWKERGFRHLLRRPVMHNGKQVAVVLLERKHAEPFTEEDVRTFDELPIAEAIDIAIGLDRKGEMQFRLDLIRDLGKVANDADKLRAMLVERLRANYSWEHVSLFRVDEDRRRLLMVCQSAIRGRELPEDDWQPLDAGLIGAARKTKRTVIVGRVKDDPRYLKGVPGTNSEMCLPVPGSRQRWILNVESSLLDAFAEEEQHSVELILGVVGFLLDRVESIEMKSAIFESVADGLIFTSKDGTIQHANPAVQRLLGAAGDALIGENLADLLLTPGKSRAPEDFGEKIVGSRRLHPLRVDLRWKRQRVAVLLSGALLPPGIGGRFFVVSDVRVAERLEQMQALKRVYTSIAAEMRIPLSLACSFVAEIRKEGAPVQALAEKTMAQLRRADLPLERILRLATLETPEALAITDVNVLEVLASIKSQLPSSQADDVRLHAPADTRPAKAAYSELAFCMQSIVSFMLRQKAQADALHIDVSQRQKKIAVDFWLARDRSGLESSTEVAALDHSVREFALADSLLASLMGRMGGKYEPRDSETPRFRLSLAS